jgi:riboflavin synthase alpha subunit
VAAWHDGTVETVIIPFMHKHMKLSSLKLGAAANVECDVLAKYVERLMEARQETPVSRLTVGRLVEEGI